MLSVGNVLYGNIGNGTAYKDLTGVTTLGKNTWYHVAMTVNNTDMTLYLNGVSDKTTNKTVVPYNTVNQLVIGGLYKTGVQHFFNGTIDDVAIFNRSLSADEILQLYKNTNKQTTLFINNSYLSSGNLTNVDDNFKIRTYLKGNGTSTPVINDITGYFDTGDSTEPYITIQEPVNSTYYTSWLWCNVTLNEEGSWCGVSLNNSANYTMTNSSGHW
jgi:hypothetical protein